jgi:prepilin-type processing-associated H-X9-DG protein
MSVTGVVNPSNFIVLSEVQFWSNKMGSTGAWGEVGAREWCNGLSVANVVSRQKNEDKGGLGGFFIHDSKSYKLNFSFGDGHVEYLSVPSTLGDGGYGFYDGSSPGWSNFVDTAWNALSE